MIVDALTHVTADGRWFCTSHDARIGTLLTQMDDAGVERAVVTGMPGYIEDEVVLDTCRAHGDRLVPVLSFDPCAWASDAERVAAARSRLRDRGARGVKLHPRLGRYDPLDPRVRVFLDELATWPEPPVVWLCTFFHSPGVALRKAPAETAHEIVGGYSSLRFVLAHGGGPDLLRMATAVRSCENALIDLSFTLVRFAGSSVETDIRYLVRTFDRRLSFGSDFPEIRLADARAQLERLAGDAGAPALRAVLGDNIRRFAPALFGAVVEAP